MRRRPLTRGFMLCTVSKELLRAPPSAPSNTLRRYLARNARIASRCFATLSSPSRCPPSPSMIATSATPPCALYRSAARNESSGGKISDALPVNERPRAKSSEDHRRRAPERWFCFPCASGNCRSAYALRIGPPHFGGMMQTLQRTVEVNVPVNAAYNQLTQFDDFPRFID